MRLFPQSQLVLLGILVFVYNFRMGIHSAGGLEPSSAFQFLYTVSFLWLVVWWLRAENRRYAIKPVYCLGLLVGVGWMIIIPYHLFKTRGVRGLIPIGALIGSLLVAHVLGVIAYLSFSY